MGSILHCYVPRWCWIIVFVCVVACVVISNLYLCLPNVQPATGHVGSDEKLFDYHQVDVKVGNLSDDVRGDVEDAPQVPAPASHRLDQGDSEMKRAGVNFTVKALLKPDVSYVFIWTKLSSKRGRACSKTLYFGRRLCNALDEFVQNKIVVVFGQDVVQLFPERKHRSLKMYFAKRSYDMT